MKKYIDVEEAEKVFKQMEENDVELYGGVHIPECFDADRAIDALKEIPAADAKEVVYCRDCKYYQKDGYFEIMLCMHKDIPVTTFESCPIDEPFFAPDEDFYCALGEKEDDPV